MSRQTMDRFLSSAINRIDAKGRVSVPAHFRAIVQKRGYSELYAVRALDAPAFEVGGPDLLDHYAQRIEQEDQFHEMADDMALLYYGDGTFLKLDQDGRITMTDQIRAYTGIATEVAFVGKGRSFQMWEPQRFRAHSEAAIARLRALRRQGSGVSQARGPE
jgi:MraZ protein